MLSQSGRLISVAERASVLLTLRLSILFNPPACLRSIGSNARAIKDARLRDSFPDYMELT